MESLDKLIASLKKFPNVGVKSARKIAYYLLRQNNDYLAELGSLITDLKKDLFICSECGNISDKDPCPICSDPLRDRKTLCIIEDVEALSSLEQSGLYNGLYHILGGKISPIDKSDFTEEAAEFLKKHIDDLEAEEVIIATSPKVEGDMTYYTLLDTLRDTKAQKVTRLAFGLPVGGAVEMADRMTLHAAFEARRQVL